MNPLAALVAASLLEEENPLFLAARRHPPSLQEENPRCQKTTLAARREPSLPRCQKEREPSHNRRACAAVAAAAAAAERVPPDAWRLGATKLFLRADALYTLQNLQNHFVFPYARRLQRWLVGDILEVRRDVRCCW